MNTPMGQPPKYGDKPAESRFEIRIPAEMKAKWRAAADQAGVKSLSEWAVGMIQAGLKESAKKTRD